MGKNKPILVQNVFEVRYDQGYRYLDRCGDAMIILENALPQISEQKMWMPDEMKPTGARMKCPELDLVLVFDTYRLCLDQNPAEVDCPFNVISKYAFDTIVSKFDISQITRFGNRKRYILAVDSVEQAESLSVKKSPIQNWPKMNSEELNIKSYDITSVYENDSRTKGIRFSMSPTFKVDAPLKLDPRLTKAPHLLEKGQRAALINQIKRQKEREEHPIAGLGIDVDYWWLNPDQDKIDDFFEGSEKQIQEILESFLG